MEGSHYVLTPRLGLDCEGLFTLDNPAGLGRQAIHDIAEKRRGRMWIRAMLETPLIIVDAK